MIKTYYNPDDQCFWATYHDSEGNQIGDAQPAATEKLATYYLQMVIDDMAWDEDIKNNSQSC